MTNHSKSGAEIPLLGNTAKSSVGTPDQGARQARAIRYQAQSQGRYWLRQEASKIDPSKHPGDVFRSADCRYSNHSDVAVNWSPAYQAAHYSGLVTCGSVWACPICASRIQERRRLEIEQAIEWATSEGLVSVLVTFTFPHKVWQTLADLIGQQRQAFKYLRQTTRWRAIRAAGGFIRSLEVTHGQNGWHPHTHELWFCDPANIPTLSKLVDLWQAACTKVGLLDLADTATAAAFRVHSVDVKVDMTAGDYLAKQDDSRTWGFSHEVAKATSKSGRAKGVHPHHFLVRQSAADRQHYIEYVQGMKGSRQLFWSPGLKASVGLDEITDEVIADESREAADILALLSPDQWKLIRGNDARVELLEAAEQGGLSGIQRFLSMFQENTHDQK